MKTLFVLFILFSSISSQGSFLDISQKLAADKEEARKLWYFLETANDWDSRADIINRWEIAFQLIDELLDAEEKGESICISLQPQEEDHNGAMAFDYWFNDMTFAHFAWVNNIGRCDVIKHQSHGRMVFNYTHPRMYDVSIEQISSIMFPELQHVNSSCRGSYEWLGDEPGKLSDANDPIYGEVFPPVESILKGEFINSEKGIGNLRFSTPTGYWSYKKYSSVYSKYIEE